ncbi:MAG TPA: sigma-70 family RNA polymerase sigma factor [Niabella sp.]
MKLLPDINESELLKRLREGDARAFEQVYQLYAAMLAYKLHKLVKIPAVVEELHQDIFLKLWNSRSNLAATTNLKAYLFTIARNTAIDFYRKASKDKELEKQLVYHMSKAYDHIEPLINSKETLAALDHLISLLPPQRQRVFRLIKLEGKSYEEASAFFGVSISTIKDHMAKSADFLKGQLSKKYPDLLFGLVISMLFR